MLRMPEVRVGDPVRHEALTVFPLFLEAGGALDYLLSDEAIGAGTLTVSEVGESGSVPELVVENKGDSRVLFIEGEELRGAKQNRVLNTSVLVAAHRTTRIPVSCVEQGRWRYSSKTFESSGGHSSSKLRHVLKKSVNESSLGGHGHRSDQGKVWQEVARQMESVDCLSATSAMSDTFESQRPFVAEFQDKLAYVEGATGLAVALGDKVVAVDLFDKPSTCRKAWARLLNGFAMDALEPGTAQGNALADDVRRLLGRVGGSDWRQTPAVGEGQEFRCDADADTHASALLFGETMVHGSAVVC